MRLAYSITNKIIFKLLQEFFLNLEINFLQILLLKIPSHCSIPMPYLPDFQSSNFGKIYNPTHGPSQHIPFRDYRSTRHRWRQFPWNARTFRPKCPYVSSNRKGGSVIPDWQSSQRRRRWKPHFVLPARLIPVRGRACSRIPWYWWGIKAIN